MGMLERLERVQHQPCAIGFGEMRDVQDNVVDSRIDRILVKMLAYETNALLVDSFQVPGRTAGIADPHLSLKGRNPLFEWCNETYFEGRPGRKNVRSSPTDDNAIARHRQVFHDLAQMAQEGVLIHFVQH